MPLESLEPGQLSELICYCRSEGIEWQQDAQLKRLSSLRIGGPARLLLSPESAQLPPLMNTIGSLNISSIVVVGGGTNILFPDEGIRGVVISSKRLDRWCVGYEDTQVVADAGVSLWRIVQGAGIKGLAGLEGLAGIPGTVGGAVFGNAGSFGTEMGHVVSHITVIDKMGVTKRLENGQIGFGYRKTLIDKDCFIISVCLRLSQGDPELIRHKTSMTIAEKKMRQPIDKPSAGCVFKNPEGGFAGRLIEDAGCKGLRCGGIVVSPLHANFFVNEGVGTSKDYRALMDIVTDRVYSLFGIVLEPEIRIIRAGEQASWL